jgi:hypothetical protein
MKSTNRISTAAAATLLLALSLASPGHTQPATAGDAATAWLILKDHGKPGISPAANGVKPTPSQLRSAYLKQADELKDFQTRFPDHPSAKEAKSREVVALSLAAINGDNTQDNRRKSVLGAVLGDRTISPQLRCEASAWSGRVDIRRHSSGGRDALLAAEETLTRRLIDDFPELTDGFDSLLGLARDSSPARGQAIARDLVAMRAAPARTKAAAQTLLDRYALVGKPLDPILAKAGAAPLPSGNPSALTVIYTWRASAPQSVTLASRMAARARTARFVGVCLDANSAAARELVATKNAPGTQLFNERGTLAQALHLGQAMTVLLVDRDGIIRDVQGAVDFPNKVAALTR